MLMRPKLGIGSFASLGRHGNVTELDSFAFDGQAKVVVVGDHDWNVRFEFSGVVAVQYPRKEVWSVGLSTGGPLERVQEASPDELVTIFIPSSPTPVTGYVIQAPRRDVIELNLSIDEAFRFTISGGVLKPGVALPESTGKEESG